MPLPPFYLSRSLFAEIRTRLFKLVGDAAELAATRDVVNAIVDWLESNAFTIPATATVTAFVTSATGVPIGNAPAWTDIISTNITTTISGYLYAASDILWHPHAGAATEVDFRLVVGPESSDITAEEDRGVMISTGIMYRTTATVVAGTYTVTLQARLVSGSASEVHHVDMIAMGNLQ